MKILEKIHHHFTDNIQKVNSIMGMGASISMFTIELLEKLKVENEKMDGFSIYKTKLSRTIDSIKALRGTGELKERYDILFNQGVVLVVAYFESFMNDLFKMVINEYPEKVSWPEKQQRVSFELNMLSIGNPTIGEIVTSALKGQINFQDLQSTMRFINEYLHLDIELENEMKDDIILYQSLRNIFIHNVGMVDRSFLKQIRETHYQAEYQLNDRVLLEEIEYENARSRFSELADLIAEKAKKKLEYA